jgi:hypothetical protein
MHMNKSCNSRLGIGEVLFSQIRQHPRHGLSTNVQLAYLDNICGSHSKDYNIALFMLCDAV